MDTTTKTIRRKKLGDNSRGIITRALQQIFQESSPDMTLRVSYEIFNSQV